MFIIAVEELDNEENWSQAEADVDQTLEQATKAIPVRKIRINVNHARKQFLLMTQLMEKRNQIIHQVGARVVYDNHRITNKLKKTESL